MEATMTPERERMKIYLALKRQRVSKVKTIVPIKFNMSCLSNYHEGKAVDSRGWKSSAFNYLYNLTGMRVYYKTYKATNSTIYLIVANSGRQYKIIKE